MFRDLKTDLKSVKSINCLIAEGGMGDLICSLVALDNMLKNCPWINLLIWVPDYMVHFSKNVLPAGAIVRSYSEAKIKYDNSRPGITTKWNGNHSPMRTHPVKYAFHVLMDKSPEISEMNYLKVNTEKVKTTKIDLPEKYFVLQGAYTEMVKTMPAATFNGIKTFLLDKGYSVVVLGKTANYTGYKDIASKAKIDVAYNFDNTLNLIDRTDLLQSAKIVQQSKGLIGMDGGLVHLAGFTDAPIVAGYTFASPKHLMPIRNNEMGYNVFPIVPEESLKCRFCQTNWAMFYEHDFRECYYGPEDFTCAKQMSADKFIAQIERLL